MSILIGDIIVHNSNLYSERVGIIDKNTRLTWKEVNQRVNQLANAFIDKGMAKGDRIALIAENSHISIEFFLAVAKAGLVGVIVNYRLRSHQIQHILNDCQAKALLVQSDFTSTIERIRPSLFTVGIYIGIGESHPYTIRYEGLLKCSSSREPEIEINESDHMWINYTGGTTGLPKGVLFTHRSRIFNCILHDFCCHLNPGDVAICDVPAFAYAGLLMIGGCLYATATLVVVPFSAGDFIQMVEQEKANFTIMHFARYQAIREYCESRSCRYDFTSLEKVAISGGEGATREQIVDMLDFFGVRQSRKVYGGTEMGTVTLLTFEDMSAGLDPGATESQKTRLNSVGRPLMGYRLKIVDENDREVSAGTAGEIVVKGPGMMDAYLNQPELNEEAFRGAPGWYYSKDIGMLDDDGYLYFKGRKDFMVKTGGFNVFPGEVETVALSHPGIAEAAMFGIADERWTHAVNLAVVLNPDFDLTEDEIIKHCRKQLAGYQTPKAVHIMDRLPTDPGSSKVLVKELTRMCTTKEDRI